MAWSLPHAALAFEAICRCQTQPYNPEMRPGTAALASLPVWQPGVLGMNILISLLITVLVIALVLWLVQQLPLDGRMKQIVRIIVIIIGIVSLLRYLAVF